MVRLFFDYYMVQNYGQETKMEHFGCLDDILGRAGWLEEAEKVVQERLLGPRFRVLGALLGACKIHGNFELG